MLSRFFDIHPCAFRREKVMALLFGDSDKHIWEKGIRRLEIQQEMKILSEDMKCPFITCRTVSETLEYLGRKSSHIRYTYLLEYDNNSEFYPFDRHRKIAYWPEIITRKLVFIPSDHIPFSSSCFSIRHAVTQRAFDRAIHVHRSIRMLSSLHTPMPHPDTRQSNNYPPCHTYAWRLHSINPCYIHILNHFNLSPALNRKNAPAHRTRNG
jgi:hypothetical protein